MSINCPECGTENLDNAVFCENCRAKIKSTVTVKCRDCGKEYEIEKGDDPFNFQCDCGENLAPPMGSVKALKKQEEVETPVMERRTTKNCHNCGAEIDARAVICPKCLVEQREIKYCTNCASEMDAKAKICPNCGVRQEKSSSGEKNPIIGVILSFFIPGLGQFYNGQSQKGIILFIAGIVCAFLIFFIIGIPLYIVVWAFSMFDAFDSATRMNKGQEVKDKLF